MIPYGVNAIGKAVDCVPGVGDRFRVKYARAPDGVLHLVEVELFVLLSSAFPQLSTYYSCREVEQLLLPSSLPAEQARYVAVCRYLPPLRGDSRPQISTWSGVPVGSPRTDFPPDTPCWRFLDYLGSQLEAETIKIRCVID
jgi:hypothetical protein